MNYCKLQIGCFIILFYIALIYYRECRKYHTSFKNSLFAKMLLIGAISIVFDGITAYTVNHLDIINHWLNMILHMFFLISVDTVVFMLFIYILRITYEYPKRKAIRFLIYIPYIINVLIVIFNINSLEYITGELSNYSMGFSAYTCFAMVLVYSISSMVVFFRRWNHIASHKRAGILTYILVLLLTTTTQIIFPQILMSSISVTILLIGVYMNLEDPALEELRKYHSEMIMGFANLIENRDNNTGGHIKRTSLYVEVIAEELRKKKKYNNILTSDYVNDMLKAAPMHDIGKISIPDAILQKPGKLTNEEFEIMKSHTIKGGEIIKETFGHLVNQTYFKIAYNMACFHHEKWNGNGYPQKLKENEIPLCARIMAVADVFDAVSEKRCYRDALPLEECFEIIARGSGIDFDPDVVQAFLEVQDKVINIHQTLSKQEKSVS